MWSEHVYMSANGVACGYIHTYLCLDLEVKEVIDLGPSLSTLCFDPKPLTEPNIYLFNKIGEASGFQPVGCDSICVQTTLSEELTKTNR